MPSEAWRSICLNLEAPRQEIDVFSQVACSGYAGAKQDEWGLDVDVGDIFLVPKCCGWHALLVLPMLAGAAQCVGRRHPGV